jgi:hypothetical protein
MDFKHSCVFLGKAKPKARARRQAAAKQRLAILPRALVFATLQRGGPMPPLSGKYKPSPALSHIISHCEDC